MCAGPGVRHRRQDMSSAIFFERYLYVCFTFLDVPRCQSESCSRVRFLFFSASRSKSLAQFLQYPHTHIAIQPGTMKQRIAALEDIPLAKFVSVYSKFTRHKIHMGFNSEVNLKIAGPAHDASGYAVRVDRK